MASNGLFAGSINCVGLVTIYLVNELRSQTIMKQSQSSVTSCIQAVLSVGDRWFVNQIMSHHGSMCC